MSTLNTTAPIGWTNSSVNLNDQAPTLWKKYLAFADSQAPNRTLWFFVSLMVHGVLFLPIPAVLMYYCDAPILVLAISLTCFFTNFISGMGGAGIRTLILCFAASIFLNIAMIVAMLF